MTKTIRIHIWLLLALLVSACGATREATESPDNDGREEVVVEDLPEVSQEEQLKSTAMLIEGIQQKLLGNPERAVTLFLDAKETDPRNDAAYYELARLHARNNELEEARGLAGIAIELDPGNMDYQLLMADIHVLGDDMSQAAEVYRQLASQHPENIRLQRNLVSVYRQKDQYDKALEVLRHIESIRGVSEETGMQKLEILIRQGDYQTAIEEASMLAELYPDQPAFIEVLGDLYMETGQAEEARATYLEMLERDPESYMARLLLADYYHEQDKPDEAFEQLKHAFRSPQLELEGKGRIIFSYMRWGEEDPAFMEQAITLSEIMKEMHPKEAEAWLIFGDILSQAGKQEEARDKYLQGVHLDPSSISVWQQILSLDLQLGDFEAMLDHSDQALEYFFEQPILFLFNGLANMQLEEYDAAASSLEYGLAMSVDDDELREDFITMLADVYYFLGAHEEADRHYEKALEINPDNATALNNYSYHLAERSERLDEALEMSARALDMEPNNAAFLDTYGWIHYQRGSYEEARKWIGEALEASDEPNGTILEHYGDVLYKLGNKEEALKYWQQAKETDNGSDMLHKKIQNGTLYE